LERGDFNFAEFYARRVRRIFPALVVVLASTYVAGWFLLLPDEFKQLGKHMAAGAGFMQNVVLNREAGYFDTASELKPLMHLWSLSVEEQFYLVAPIVIWGGWRVGLNVLSLVAMAALISFGINIADIADHPTRVFFLPHT
jgi:peptidoglycan/LPS O-acetylase OafA/YrhL